jgi:hypothetical protein
MRVRSFLRIGAGAALAAALVATGDVFPQRGKDRDGKDRGGKAAGHQAATAPKQAGAGPAMTRPAGQPKAAPRPAGSREGPKGVAKGGGDGPNPKVGGGPGTGDRAASGFQRPTAPKTADARPGGPKAGGDARPQAKTADRRPTRPGGGASSDQLNDFLGGGSGRPGSDRPRPDTADRPGVAKKDDRRDVGKNDDRRDVGRKDDRRDIDRKDDRPGVGKKDDRRDIDRKDDRPVVGKNDDRREIPRKDDRPGATVEGDVNIGGKTVNYVDNQKAWVNNRQATGNQVRANAGNRYAAAYTSGGYRAGAGGGYAYNRGWAGRGAYYGWTPTSYAALGTFVGASAVAAQPTYYAYGDGGNVYYEGDNVYVGGRVAGTAEEYAKQALAFVAAAPAPEKAADAEWLPLGTFAVTREDVEDSQAMIELAISKQGVLAGTYYNEATGTSRPLKGTLDAKSQRVAVGPADGKNTDLVLETGIYNLTQDEAPGLVHFGTAESTPILLVRLKAPK